MSAAPLPVRSVVLVVEDALPIRLVLARSLAEAGYDVLTAPDGQSAISLVEGRRDPLDLVVTDLRMPTMGGKSLAAWLAARYPRLPVIFISGFRPDNPRELSGPFLAKPFSADELLNVVRAALASEPAAAGSAESHAQP
jgi:two-component system, cell cycle sensor histidine kinase and response regulator CckA